jgi:hypothetical protein
MPNPLTQLLQTPSPRLADQRKPVRIARFRANLLLLSCVILSACGGGASTSTSGSGGPDPLVEDFGIAYVRQPVPDMDTADTRQQTDFNEGSDLIFRDLASPGANERNITFRVTGGLGDVKDVEAAYDGSKLLFALRMPEIENAAPEDQPKWNIWEYEIATDTLRRIIVSDITAEAGHDVAPHYLPDGRIIFSSTRQRTSKAILLDDGKPQYAAVDEDRREPALVLHTMDENGDNIQQVSFNQSHDLDPVVLENGEVVFSRWDNMGSRSGIHLYKMYPDGTNLRLFYGANSHDTGTNGATVQFIQPREMPDGGLAALIKPFSGTFQGGDIVRIDTDNYVENVQPTAVNQGVLTGPAQASAAFNAIATDTTPSLGGRFNSFYPLWDGTDRALITWSPCRVVENNLIVPCTPARVSDPNVVEAPPLYSVYLYDMNAQTQIPVFTPQEGFLYRDVVAAQPRQRPTVWMDQQGDTTQYESFDFDPNLVAENVGILNIRSVYDFDGTFNPLGSGAADIETLADPGQSLADDRPARFLRVVKAVAIPDDDLVDLNGADFGVSTQQLMREIIGYAPIEPDGSVRVKVPANIPFAISVLDKDGKRMTSRHQSWLQLRPGEVINCTGCHTAGNGMSHGRHEAFTSVYGGAPLDGVAFTNTISALGNGSALLVDQGDTMAEVLTDADNSAMDLSVDIHYQDIWTDETAAGRVRDASFDYNYSNLDASLTAPVSTACQTNWSISCRITINYEQHIHPLWNLARGADTCTDCHTNTDNMGLDRIPDAQLDLTDGPSDINADHFKSYRELLSNDAEQELVMVNGNMVLVDKQVPVLDAMGNPVFLTDAMGNLILDAMGNPIPLTTTVNVPRSMSPAGSSNSPRFFNIFAPGGTHAGRLSAAELKLLAEWLDIGGQYYNDPFAVPP